MKEGYFKKEVDLGGGQKKIIVYKADYDKTIMYRDGQEFDMTDKLPLVVFGMNMEYDAISKAEALKLIASQKA